MFYPTMFRSFSHRVFFFLLVMLVMIVMSFFFLELLKLIVINIAI